MVIADPYGSWVEGAHQGQQDAIQMRNALDETAQRNYNLNREAAFDPLAYRTASNTADTSDLELGANRDIYHARIPQQAAQAGLESKQLGNTQVSANLGNYAPYYAHEAAGGAQLGTGGLSYPGLAQDENGQHVPFVTPLTSISNRYQVTNNLRSEYQQARIEAQMRGQDLSYEKFIEGRNPGASSNPTPNGGYLQIPKANITAPTTTSAGTPQKGIDLNNPYGLH